jgi:hypothetical protein
MKKTARTDLPFVSSSMLMGWARLLDLGSNLDLYNASRSEEEADQQALSADWDALGQDMRTAITQVTAQLLDEPRD